MVGADDRLVHIVDEVRRDVVAVSVLQVENVSMCRIQVDHLGCRGAGVGEVGHIQ